MVTPKGVVLDLDDTLFLESAYTRSGFAVVAKRIAAMYGLDADEVLSEFLAVEAAGNRGRVFDAWLQGCRRDLDGLEVQALVEIYRSHEPEITLLPGIFDLLAALRRASIRLGLISDGWLTSQEAKVRALGLQEKIDRILLTDQWGRAVWKPNPHAFLVLQSEWRQDPNELVYVADNPDKDFLGPNALGWQTVRLRIPGQRLYGLEATSRTAAPGLEVRSVEELARVLLGQ